MEVSNTEALWWLIALVTFWTVMNILSAKKMLPRNTQVSYGVVLLVKKAGNVKATGVFKKARDFLVVAYIVTLLMGVVTIILSIYVKLTTQRTSTVILVPGINITGLDLILFAINVGIAATVHEFFHAKTAVSNGVGIKGYGIGLILFIPLAFVEVEEEAFSKAQLREKLAVLSAGPVANMALALVSILLLSALAYHTGLLIISVSENSIAERFGLKAGDILISVNQTELRSHSDLSQYTSLNEDTVLNITYLRPGEGIKYVLIEKPANVSKIGVVITPAPVRPEVLTFLGVSISIALMSFITWMYVVNNSLAILNALPIFISDGGRFFIEVAGEKIGQAINIVGVILLVALLLSSGI